MGSPTKFHVDRLYPLQSEFWCRLEYPEVCYYWRREKFFLNSIVVLRPVHKLPKLFIMLTNFSWKPILPISFSKQSHSTLLYALFMSSFTAISPILPIFFWLIWCIVSKATTTLLVMRRSDINALWFSLITCRNKHFNLLSRTLDASLNTTLLRLIDWYWVILVGYFIFGMRITWVSLKFGGTMHD